MRVCPVIFCVAGLTLSAVTAVSAAPAYWISEIEVINDAKVKEFGAASAPIVAKYGGVYLSRRNKVESAIGSDPSSVTIIQVTAQPGKRTDSPSRTARIA